MMGEYPRTTREVVHAEGVPQVGGYVCVEEVLEDMASDY